VVTITGKGVTVALTEDAAPTAMFTTLTDYAEDNHLHAPRRAQFRQVQDGTVGSAAAAHHHPAAPANAASVNAAPAAAAFGDRLPVTGIRRPYKPAPRAGIRSPIIVR
jgi:hypothetical protein